MSLLGYAILALSPYHLNATVNPTARFTQHSTTATMAATPSPYCHLKQRTAEACSLDVGAVFQCFFKHRFASVANVIICMVDGWSPIEYLHVGGLQVIISCSIGVAAGIVKKDSVSKRSEASLKPHK